MAAIDDPFPLLQYPETTPRRNGKDTNISRLSSYLSVTVFARAANVLTALMSAA
jgi:hypothetical protein